MALLAATTGLWATKTVAAQIAPSLTGAAGKAIVSLFGGGLSKEEKKRRSNLAEAFLISAGVRPEIANSWHLDQYRRAEMYVNLARTYGYPVIEVINRDKIPTEAAIMGYLRSIGAAEPATGTGLEVIGPVAGAIGNAVVNRAQTQAAAAQSAGFGGALPVVLLLAAAALILTRKR